LFIDYKYNINLLFYILIFISIAVTYFLKESFVDFLIINMYIFFKTLLQRANEGERVEFISSLIKVDKQITVTWYR